MSVVNILAFYVFPVRIYSITQLKRLADASLPRLAPCSIHLPLLHSYPRFWDAASYCICGTRTISRFQTKCNNRTLWLLRVLILTFKEMETDLFLPWTLSRHQQRFSHPIVIVLSIDIGMQGQIYKLLPRLAVVN